jgi:hypothetical protein
VVPQVVPQVDCDSLCTRARHGSFVTVLGESGMASRSTSTGCVVGPIGRLVADFREQHRVCDLGLGDRVVVQHGLDRLPSSGEGDGTCIAGGALVPQLHKPAADIPVLVEDRFGDLGLGAIVVVTHTDQSAGRR